MDLPLTAAELDHLLKAGYLEMREDGTFVPTDKARAEADIQGVTL